MANNVYHTSFFENRYKRLARKHKTLEQELQTLEKELTLNPEQGTSLGANLFKIRLAVESKGKVKSGGFRVNLSPPASPSSSFRQVCVRSQI